MTTMTTTSAAVIKDHPTTRRKPILADDVISVKGRYLYVGNNNNITNNNSSSNNNDERFFIRGIAFPTPPASAAVDSINGQLINIQGWIAVLEQLANETDINTIRVYEMDCSADTNTDSDSESSIDYSPFLNRAAELGIYVIVPLTSRGGDGVLSRDKRAPKCYPKKLYDYGKTCIDTYWNYPNVLGGVVGNEVMNTLEAWDSAPCVKSYLNDLELYSQYKSSRLSMMDTTSGTTNRKSLPLIYATQHDSPSAELVPDEAIRLTLDYLSCNDDKIGNNNEDEDVCPSITHNNFIFGINIESWCSSYETFVYEEDGISESSYHSLWRTLWGRNNTKIMIDAVSGTSKTLQELNISPYPINIPVIFSEMGCSKYFYNRDNEINEDDKFVRDWKQIPLVASTNGQMSDIFSGFVAYAYDGGGFANFQMMGNNEIDGGNWDGIHPLPPSKDYDNFRKELSKAIISSASENSTIFSGDNIIDTNISISISVADSYHDDDKTTSCSESIAKLHKYFGIKMYPLSYMPSYFTIFEDSRSSSSRWKQRKPITKELNEVDHCWYNRMGKNMLAARGNTKWWWNRGGKSTLFVPGISLVLAAIIFSLIYRKRYYHKNYTDEAHQQKEGQQENQLSKHVVSYGSFE